MKIHSGDDDPVVDEHGGGSNVIDDFSAHSCSTQHGCGDGLLKTVSEKCSEHNIPSTAKTIFTDTYAILWKSDELSSILVDEERKIVKCKGCVNDLGFVSNGTLLSIPFQR
jgi:hypothetical protein